uniref:GPI ethanolamine phosphate transferase 2 C-terminal domain-containing protein n=1 Tax=Electrophorus electricus TaxID=8005 RepID=A0A4W4G4F4_ELEEL
MRLKASVFALFCLIIELLGIALYLRGFFPPAEPLAGSGPNSTQLPPPLFKRVVIMLIDALREDFVFGPNGKRFMPFTRQIVEEGSSHGFIAKARAPTVTMPRIKALTTGSIPGFIDVVMNLNSPALLEDNLIRQAKDAGKRIVFYGDDTWVRLFPRHFTEHDGTTSFFVSDYTEVDNNVTRHLDSTLKRADWDVLILHYLGLDHIGHISGPHSALIGPKLLEMDDIIKKIHTSLTARESEDAPPDLLVLCSDHGMSETGSHGGSSEPEVSTPLVLISLAFPRKGGAFQPSTVEQVDLAPTLALALALPIPRNSVGRLLPAVVEQAPLREQLRLLHLNGHQLSSLLRDSNPTYQRQDGYELFRVAEKAHGNWMKLYLEGNTSEVLGNLGRKVLKQYLEALQSMSLALSKQLGRYDMYSMIVGMGLILEVLALLLLAMPEALGGAACVDVPLAPACLSLPFCLLGLLACSTHVLMCTSAEANCYFCSLPWPLAFSALLFVAALLCSLAAMAGKRFRLAGDPRPKVSSSLDWTLSELDILLLTGTVGQTLSLGASSFIEEEHQTWYFLLNTLCLAVFQDVCRKYFKERRVLGEEREESSLLPSTTDGDPLRPSFSPATELGVSLGAEKWLALTTPLLTLVCCRLLRSLNQTGVQWAHLPDLGHWLNNGEHKVFLSVLAVFSLLLIFLLVQRHCSLVSTIALALGLLGIYSYRAAVGSVLFPWQHTSRSISKGTGEARFVYVFVLGILFTGVKDLLCSQVTAAGGGGHLRSRGLWEVYSGMVLLVALLLRPHNLPTLACCLLVQTLMVQFVWERLRYDAAQITIMHYWFGQAFFYFQGNSNNIATVDISVGFVGLESYVEVPAVILTAFCTYAGPVLWACHLMCYLSSERDRAAGALSHGCYCLAVLRSVPAALYVALTTALRYHLFIWSVFSPKLLYEATHVLIAAAACLIFTAVDHDHACSL